MDLRPRPNQTDEDLIKENEEFLKNLKRKTDEKTDLASTASLHEDKRQKPTEHVEDFMHNEPSIIIGKAKAPHLILGDVIEKNIVKPTPKQKQKLVASKHGFPIVFRRDKSIICDSHKQSIFARMQQKTESPEVPTPSVVVNQVFGSTEAQQIDEENRQRIASMSQEEILSAQRELLSRLNPEAIQMLKARGASKLGQGSVNKQEKQLPAKPLIINDSAVIEDIEPLKDLPIDPVKAKEWLHMDVVETDKLRWMTQLPPPKPLAAGQSYAARFSFDGTLLDPMAEVPVTESLHHHGQEQERAGYTLEELLLFSRSTIPQQRVIGLTTVGNILALAKQGRLDKCLEEPLLPQLLAAGIFAALRFSLDEGVPMVIEAAVHALTAIICSEPDEVCLRQLRGTSYSATLPNLCCSLEEEGPKEKGQEALQEGDLKDHELLQLDVVKGALRTTLVPRIRYLLEVTKPSPKTVQCLLRVLARLGLHSRDAAVEIAGCPGLLATIITQFVPSSWEFTTGSIGDMESVYGVPQARALSLLRVLASQSRAIASDLTYKYHVMTCVLSYLAAEPCESGIPDGASVILEALYLWQTLLSHALTLDNLQEFSGVLGRLISHHTFQTKLGSQRFLVEHAVALLSLLQTVLTLTPNHADKIPRELIVSLGPPLLHAAARWLKEASDSQSLSFSDLKLVGAGLNIVCAGYNYALHWPQVDEVSWLSQLDTMLRSVVVPFLHNSTYTRLTNSLKSHSSFTCAEANSGKKRDPKGLPSLGAVMWGQIVTPSMQVSSPLPLLEPLSAFLVCACQLLPQTTSMLVQLQDGAKDYLQTIATAGCPGAGHWFSRWEERLACCLLNLLALAPVTSDTRVFHCAALNLLPALSFQQLTQGVMSSWIFSQKAFQEDLASGLLGSLHLSKTCHLTTTVPAPPSELLRQAYETLPSLLTTYSGYEVLPRDWPYLPLVAAAENAEQSKQAVDGTQIQRCLQWVLLLETLRPEVVSQMLSPTGRFCRLSCLFLTGSNVFLDPHIHALADAVLRTVLSSGNLDFAEAIPGLKSFWELFVALARTFAAESYGDALFANVLLLPLQQHHDAAYRRHLWGEQAAVLRFLRLEPSQLMVSMEGFLQPPETDVSLLNCYLQLLLSGTVRGVLATIATHHLTEYTRTGSDETLKSRITLSLSTPQVQQIISQVTPS